MAENRNRKQDKRESGLPGGGAGRRDEAGGSGVYPASGPHPKDDVPIVPAAAWGQGERGAAGYADSGTSELWQENSKPSLCRDLMTKDPVCCLRSDSPETVASLMRAHGIGEIPVVETMHTKKLVGVITDRDIVIRGIADGADCKGSRVDTMMTSGVATCSPDHDVWKCLEAMEAKQIRRVPVTDDSGRIVGIIAQADIALRLREPSRTAEVVLEISRPRTAA